MANLLSETSDDVPRDVVRRGQALTRPTGEVREGIRALLARRAG